MRLFSVSIFSIIVLSGGCIDERLGRRKGLELESQNDSAAESMSEGEGEGEQPGDQKAGEDSCMDVKNCIENCPPRGGDCAQTCFEFGTLEAQHAYTALEYCNAVNSCLGNSDCIAEECDEEANVCGVPEPAPPGPDSCVGIFECFDGCGPRGRPCLYACVEQAEPDARLAYDELASCMDRNCEELRENEALRECAERECSESLRSCFEGDKDSGVPPEVGEDMSCPEVIECFNRCGEGNQECQTSCFQNATPPAQQALVDLEECMGAACADVPMEEIRVCAERECIDELMACLGELQ